MAEAAAQIGNTLIEEDDRGIGLVSVTFQVAEELGAAHGASLVEYL